MYIDLFYEFWYIFMYIYVLKIKIKLGYISKRNSVIYKWNKKFEIKLKIGKKLCFIVMIRKLNYYIYDFWCIYVYVE